MSTESRVFTVSTIVETSEGITVAHFDYQGPDRANDAMKKWHTECAYNRDVNTIKYFCATIVNEWGGIEQKDEYANPNYAAPILEGE